MCNCIRESAFKEDFNGKTEKKMGLRTEIEGLRRHKVWIDEKYRDLEGILKPDIAISEKKDRKNRISKNLEDVNPDRRL